MATITYKCLGQSAPSATTETTLYTVPASTSAVVSTIVVCNRGAATTFRISVAVGGGATGNKDYVYYDVSIAAADSFAATFGVTLATTDKIKVYAGTADLSFSAFGSEIS